MWLLPIPITIGRGLQPHNPPKPWRRWIKDKWRGLQPHNPASLTCLGRLTSHRSHVVRERRDEGGSR